jgi:hypothetical protein
MEIEYFICMVCGYPKLTEQSWDFDDPQPYSSWGICPSCGTHFGYHDFGITKEEIITRQRALREQ